MPRVISVLLLFAALAILAGCGGEKGEVQTSASGPQPQTQQGGGVTVTVTPQSSGEGEPWSFQVVFDTHSVDLNQDVVQISVLIADGKEYAPVAWEGDPPGGHHRKGTLKFSVVSPKPQKVELKINGVGEVDHSFSWTID